MIACTLVLHAAWSNAWAEYPEKSKRNKMIPREKPMMYCGDVAKTNWCEEHEHKMSKASLAR